MVDIDKILEQLCEWADETHGGFTLSVGYHIKFNGEISTEGMSTAYGDKVAIAESIKALEANSFQRKFLGRQA